MPFVGATGSSTTVRVYFDPTKPRKRPNLVSGILQVASHSKQERFEDLVSEVLGWLLDRSAVFARAFADLFVRGCVEGEGALKDCSTLGAATQVSLPHPHGSGVVRPDLALTGESRKFQLLVEVKVDADFHSYTVDGAELVQPDAYAYAWKHRELPRHRRRWCGVLARLTPSMPMSAISTRLAVVRNEHRHEARRRRV